jgi:cell division protein FtsB
MSDRAAAPAAHFGTTAIRPTVRALVLIAVVLGVVVLSVAPVRSYLDQRSQLAGLQRQAHALERRSDRLAEQIRQLRDPASLEQIARRCLGMIRPGEIAFVTVPEHGIRQPAGC